MHRRGNTPRHSSREYSCRQSDLVPVGVLDGWRDSGVEDYSNGTPNPKVRYLKPHLRVSVTVEDLTGDQPGNTLLYPRRHFEYSSRPGPTTRQWTPGLRCRSRDVSTQREFVYFTSVGVLGVTSPDPLTLPLSPMGTVGNRAGRRGLGLQRPLKRQGSDRVVGVEESRQGL